MALILPAPPPTAAGAEGIERDEIKAHTNSRKHGVDFADTTIVFEDERTVTIKDIITAVDEYPRLAPRRSPSRRRR